MGRGLNRRRAAGPSTTRSSAPDRSPSATRRRRSSTSSSARPIFKRAWLNVGRVEELPRVGSYFTKEIDAAKTSVIVVKGKDEQIRAFYNVCRHRGNKLVWNDFPERRGQRHLPPVHLQVPRLALRPRRRTDVRAAGGRVLRPRQCAVRVEPGPLRRLERVHLHQPRPRATPESARVPRSDDHRARRLPVRNDDRALRFRRPQQQQLEDLRRRVPGVLPRAVAALRSRCRARCASPTQAFECAHFQIDGPHRLVSTAGTRRWLLAPEYMYPIERATRSGLVGPWRTPETHQPAGLNPGGIEPWGITNFQIFPNLEILIYRGWYLLYRYWPTSHNTHKFEAYNAFPSRTHGARAHRARGRRGGAQGVRAAGRRHARRYPGRPGVRRRRRLPAQRPGDPGPPPAQGGRRLGRGLPATNATWWECDHDRPATAQRLRRTRAVRREVVPGNRTRAVGHAAWPPRCRRCGRSTTRSRLGSRRRSTTATSSRSTTCPTTR